MQNAVQQSTQIGYELARAKPVTPKSLAFHSVLPRPAWASPTTVFVPLTVVVVESGTKEVQKLLDLSWE